jgi:synaptobrevin family protein YKT6
VLTATSISEYNCHVYRRSDGLTVCVSADLEYPARVAFVFGSKLMDDFVSQNEGWEKCVDDSKYDGWAPLQEAITEYQDPAKADKITAIQKELDDTTAVLVI